ncbi:hypothetical protein AB6A40_002981 [Gnathostoma spinigerum]|uniref:VWFA domain-containing protein n=1 Tax=Gnathostoma spinigerum TaxID=75299 RepID=A0ABD6EAF9_9BILA
MDDIQFISGLEANGGTNLWIAIKECYDMLRQHEESHPNSFASMVFLMTDGRPTVGAQDPSYFSYKIRSLKGDHVIHAVAFGSGSDFAFIQHITNSRHGISRRIYEDADAYIQIAGNISE